MAGSYRALPQLKIGGKIPPDAFLEDLLQVFVEESLHQPGMFTLVIRNDYQPGQLQAKPWKYKSLLQIGKSVEIGFVSSTTYSEDFKDEKKGTILKGEITAIETHFTERTQAPIVVRGYDVSHRLYRGRQSRSFQDMTDSDIVKKVIREAGIQPGTIDASGVVHEYVFQQNQTNMEFLRERAARIGFELFVRDGKLCFRKPKPNPAKSLALEWLVDLHSFRVRVTSSEQVKEVEVRAWDYSTKRPIIAKARRDRVITKTQTGKGSRTSSAFKRKPSNPRMVVVNQPLFKQKEADAMAKALCDDLGGQFIHADAKGEGNPEIRPGRVVTLKNLGTHSGKYYITETRHIYVERVYTTEFTVRGMHSGNLMATIAPTPHLQPGQTFLVGIVTDNQDPKGWGRVKVKFPTLTEAHNSNWARVVSVGAGKQRGFDCLPEINDEVLVVFEHGDIHRPYVLGGVWNGKDKPPNSVQENVLNGKVRLRTFKTRAGHQIQFVDENTAKSQKGIRIDTNKGHQIYLNDNDGSILIKSMGNMTLDARGQMDINAKSINMKATGLITVRGSLIKLN